MRISNCLPTLQMNPGSNVRVVWADGRLQISFGGWDEQRSAVQISLSASNALAVMVLPLNDNALAYLLPDLPGLELYAAHEVTGRSSSLFVDGYDPAPRSRHFVVSFEDSTVEFWASDVAFSSEGVE